MLNWFGPRAWDAPLCDDVPRCAPPLDTPCNRCDKAITLSDSGVTMPGSSGPVAFHLSCHLKAIVSHHQWENYGLVPDAFDGLVNGRFECPTCGIVYSVTSGWSRKKRQWGEV